MALPDPATLFPEANALGTVLMDKVNMTTPDTVCLDKEDGDKYLLYASTAMMKAIHIIADAVETEITGDIAVNGEDHTPQMRKEAFRTNLQKPSVGIRKCPTHVLPAG